MPRPGYEVRKEGGDALDRWLRCRLRLAYDAIAREPIPAELLRIIQEGRKT